MAHDASLEMINQLKTWIEERFLALHEVSSDGEERNEAMARYRKLTSIIHQLEGLRIPIPEDVEAEKLALEEFLHTPNEEESKLVFLSKELSSLAKDINYRLRGMRSQKTPEGKKAPSKRLRVEFSDGTIINDSKSTNTFVDAMRHMGLQRVSELPIKKDGGPLVSARKPTSATILKNSKDIDGYFINAHSSTNAKAKYLQQIADALQIDISVRVVD